ncbi:MAG: hypothetical protein J6T77_03305 [Clostridia bacterium]|nr:hypothetical protein [Clostridia bacterium]
MTLILIANIIVCICAFIGFIYGMIKFFKPRKAVYAQMIALAVGCVAFGRLYQVVRLLTGGDMTSGFQLGVFGVIGSLLFLFSANFGAMDSLADDKSRSFMKYRLISLVAPVAALVLYIIFVWFTDLPRSVKIASALVTVFVMQASYFHLKHLIFPDVDLGIIKCLRRYNLLALIYTFLCMAEMVVIGLGDEIGILIVGVLIGAILIGVVISAERGIKKWTI